MTKWETVCQSETAPRSWSIYCGGGRRPPTVLARRTPCGAADPGLQLLVERGNKNSVALHANRERGRDETRKERGRNLVPEIRLLLSSLGNDCL
jgi:hypothetical protein